jgi:hypothetical protein
MTNRPPAWLPLTFGIFAGMDLGLMVVIVWVVM